MRFFFLCLALGAWLLAGGPALAQDATDETIDDISLEALLDVKVSAASKYDQNAQDAPASVTVISNEDLAAYGYQTLQEALASVRGLFITDDQEYAYIGVRGVSPSGDYNNRVLILLNGHTLNEGTTGFSYIDERLGIDLNLVERIEVVRGPGSALYGTGAMLTVINVVTQDGETGPAFQTTARLGSHADRQGSAALHRTHANGAQWTVSGRWGFFGGQRLYFEEFDAPEYNAGIADRLDERSYRGVFASGRYKGLSAQGQFAFHETGVPAAANRARFNSPESGTEMGRGFAEVTYDHAFSPTLSLRTRGYYNYFALNHIYHIQKSSGASRVDHDRGVSNGVGTEVRMQWDVHARNRLVGGLEYRTAQTHYRLWQGNTGLEYDGRYTQAVFSAYVQDEWRLVRDLAVTVGLRHDQYSTAGSATTPRVGLVAYPTRTATAKLLYGEAFRAPSLYELNFESNHFGVIRNPNLSPEHIRTLEFVWEQRLTAFLTGTVAAYQFWMHDLIDFGVNLEAGGLQYNNIGQLSARGVELELNARWGPQRHAYVRYALQHAHEIDSHADLVNSPAQVLRVGGVAPVGPVFIAPEVHVESGRRTFYTAEPQTDAFALVHLTMRTRAFWGGARASLSLRNALDAAYAFPAGREHDPIRTITQDGRSVCLSLTYTL